MKIQYPLRLGAAFLVAAASVGASSAFAQVQSNNASVRSSAPPRQGNSANDQAAFESTFNTLRAGKARMELLGDPGLQDEHWAAADRFASCATNFNAERVRELLDQAVEGKAKKRVELGDFVNRNQGCVVAAGGIDGDFLRGAMAQTLVTSSTEALPPPGDAAAVTKFIKTVSVPRMDKEDPFITAQLVAECRVGFAPVAARGLLATEPGTPAETGALAAMKAVTPQCNSLDTARTKVTPRFERAFAAQALYHWMGFDRTAG
jgi:hypothetical protein